MAKQLRRSAFFAAVKLLAGDALDSRELLVQLFNGEPLQLDGPLLDDTIALQVASLALGNRLGLPADGLLWFHRKHRQQFERLWRAAFDVDTRGPLVFELVDNRYARYAMPTKSKGLRELADGPFTDLLLCTETTPDQFKARLPVMSTVIVFNGLWALLVAECGETGESRS